ncbi:MAG: ribosome maturation factor [Balneolaceae bacterium]
MQTDTIQNIKDLATPLAEAEGLFVVDVEINTGGVTEVSLFLDGEDRGISLDECADISRELGFLLEAHEVFEREYRLNISSPGLSRPLSDIRQYKKNIGRTAKMKYKEEEDFKKAKGVIVAVTEQSVTVDDEEAGAIEVPFNDILETKIVPKI